MYTAAVKVFGTPITAEEVEYTAAPGYPPGTDNVQEALDYLAGAMPPTVASMLPLVEGIAYGETDQLGRTMLGYGVDNSSSNNIALWSSVTPQALCNATSAITAFVDTDTAGATMLNSVVMLESGSVAGTNLSNSVVLGRGSDFSNGIDYTQSNIVANEYVSQVGDEISTTQAMIRGSFDQPSQFTNSVVIGEVNNLRTLGPADAAIVIRPGNAGGAPVRVAAGGCLIGQGVAGTVVSTGEFRLSAYNNYYVDGIPASPAANVLVYDTVTNRITYDTAPTSYTLPVKQPNTLGGQYGISSLGNASEVNGRSSFVNYAAGPLQLSGVSSVGSSQFQVNNPGLTSFTNCIFLGRTHSFNALQSIADSLLAANIVTGANISQIVNSNIIVPKAGSLTFTYAGAVTGANIVSSGAVICVSDPLYSTVLSSGGSVTPAGSNLILATNQGGGSISMNGSGNSLVFSAGNSVAYSWPVGVSNSCVLQNGTSVVTPSASTQLCSNHTSFRMPNINAVATADINTLPLGFNSATGLIAPTLSSLFSRVYRAVGTTGVGGQVTFTPGGSINPTTVGYAFNATVRNTSTTVAYTCSINAVTATTVTVQVFNSVTVVLASPSMVPSGAGIIVHFSMNY